MTAPEIVGIASAVIVPAAALIAYVVRSTVAPLKVVVENNTKAMDRVVQVLDKHEEQLEDHEVRITKVETVHEYEARE